jgi:hypothetical protein
MARWRMLAFTSGVLFALGCSRPVSHDSTKITIQAPAAFGKVGAMASMPANRKVCYGVNVAGPGIDSDFATVRCAQGGIKTNLRTGIIAGFVEPGQEISISVQSGSNRKIELFAYLLATGDAGPCPAFDKVLSPATLLNTYKVGSAENILIQGAQQAVEIVAVYPGDANTLAADLNIPATCSIAGAPNTGHGGFHVSSGMQQATGTGLKLKARIGSIQGAKTLSNGSYKLYVK